LIAYFAIAFCFSAQSIKIQQSEPVPEEDAQPDYAAGYGGGRGYSKKDSLADSYSYSSAGSGSETAEKKKTKMPLKNFKPVKDGSLFVPPKTQQNQAQINPGRQPSQENNNPDIASQSYAKKKTVHLKNYKPEEDKSFVDWQQKKLSHFQLYYEKGTENIIGTLSMHLEATFTNMRLTMPIFPHWIDKEKPLIYLYATKEKYLNNEYKPMEWSLAIAVPSKKTIVAYADPDLTSLKSTLAHELSHLYLQSFFSENKAVPPLWIDEGLAIFMGNQIYKGSGFYDAKLKSYPDIKLYDMPAYFSSGLKGLSDEQVSDWYVQAFIVFSFLKESGNNIQFKNFFTRLRNGEKETALLTGVYRFKNMPDFNKKLAEWLSVKSGKMPQPDIFSDFSTGRSEAGKNNSGQLKRLSFGSR